MVFSSKFLPDSDNLVCSAGWDRNVKFWDVRSNSLTHNLQGPQICGESIDVQKDGRIFATGGGAGEGIQTWDLRNLSKGPLLNIKWSVLPGGHVQNALVNVLKFIPNHNVLIAGASDPKNPAKCFNSATGELIETFPRLGKAGFALDISSDKNQLVLGDAAGRVHFEQINYSA